MPVLNVNFGRSPSDVALESLKEQADLAANAILGGQLSEADYKHRSGLYVGLLRGIEAIETAARELSKEK